MHNTAATPFLHLGIVVILVLALVAFVAIKKVQDRKRRNRPSVTREAGEHDHG
jgi:hypothetical protein